MINAVEVKRDNDGFWTHPDFPGWDESVTPEQILSWQLDNNIKLIVVMFDGDGPSELEDRYFFNEELEALKEWEPTKPDENAFLFSIHDTEDGPTAVWALHNTQTEK